MVPSKIVNKIFLKKYCNIAVNITEIIVGQKLLYSTKEVSFIEYITNIPIIAGGRIFPKNLINRGVFLWAGKIINGRKRVNMVPKITTDIVRIDSVNVIAY